MNSCMNGCLNRCITRCRKYCQKSGKKIPASAALLLVLITNLMSAFAITQNTSALSSSTSTKTFRLLITGDPQFDNGDGLDAENARSEATLKLLGDRVLNKNDDEDVLIIIAGDLVQNTRKDEFDYYKNVISPFAYYVFDTIGNHDEMPTSFLNALGCPWLGGCVAKGYILDYLNRQRALPILYSQRCGALYVVKVGGLYLIQLGVGVNEDGFIQADGHFNYNSFGFLKHVLENVVEPRGAPVAITMHIPAPQSLETDDLEIDGLEMDSLSTGNRLEALLQQHNIVLLIYGHTHFRNLSTESFPYVLYTGTARDGSYFDITILKDYLQINRPDGRQQLLPFFYEPEPDGEILQMDTEVVADFGEFTTDPTHFRVTDSGAREPQILLLEYPSHKQLSLNHLGASHCYIPFAPNTADRVPVRLNGFVERCRSYNFCTGLEKGVEEQTVTESDVLTAAAKAGAFFISAPAGLVMGILIPISINCIYLCRSRRHVRH